MNVDGLDPDTMEVCLKTVFRRPVSLGNIGIMATDVVDGITYTVKIERTGGDWQEFSAVSGEINVSYIFVKFHAVSYHYK